MNNQTYQLAESLGQILLSKDAVVSTAESCTGGGISAAITAVPGSSQWFNAGFVVYSNEMKEAMLNVSGDALTNYGAVSEEVVRQMVVGAVAKSGANFSLAISGIAGPSGATATKPVGTVCFAVGSLEHVHTYTCYFDGDRQAVREQSIIKALQLLVEFASEEMA